MADFKLLNYASTDGAPRPAILAGDSTVVDLQEALPGKSWTASTLAVIGAWDEALPALKALAAAKPAKARRLSDTRLLAPLLYPPAIYCTGANYMAHAEEMHAVVQTQMLEKSIRKRSQKRSEPRCPAQRPVTLKYVMSSRLE